MQLEETEQASEPDSDMAGILELSDWEFKTMMANMLRAPMEKVDHMQGQIDNSGREMEILRIKNAPDQNHWNTNENAFDGLISRQVMA